ncbi:MAG: hypothetical protein SGARI_000245, partial [Bacillariaceae sp.]
MKGASKKAGGTKKAVVRSSRKKSVADVPKVVPKLPPDWPVTSCPPSYPADASALRPGVLLQEKCSGQDIHLARSAAASVSIDKEKGKLLLIFPGQMSFHKTPLSSSQPRSCSTSLKDSTKIEDKEITAEQHDKIDQSEKKAKSGQSKDDDGEYSHDEDLSAEDDEKETILATSKPTPNAAAKKTTTSLPPASLGVLEDVRTETPVFKIQFPHLHKTLVFPGKKVSVTSKFVMLSCASKQKMAVQCKSIFSSAVVFGAPKWEEMEGLKVEANIVADGNACQGISEVVHYGGSSRSIDSTTRRGAQKEASKEDLIPIVRKIGGSDATTSIFGFPGMEEFESGVKTQQKAITGPKNDAADLDDLIDEDKSSESDFSLELTHPKKTASSSAAVARTAPRRQASLNRKSYAATEEEGDEESDASSDSDVKEVSRLSKRARATKPQSKTKAASPPKPTEKSQASKKDFIVIDSSSDSDSDIEEVPPPPKRTKTSKEQSNKNASTRKLNPVSKGASASEPRPGRTAAAAAKKNLADLLDSDS